MGFMSKLFSNTKKPEGLMGKMMVNSMNKGHAEVSDWGISHLDIEAPAHIGEMGCGGGRNSNVLLKKYPGARLTALDYSSVSVEKTKALNSEFINEGRCAVVEGNVSQLPFADETFDLMTAFETVYFWPGPVKSFKEIRRCLMDGGHFLIVDESDGLNPADQKWLDMIDNMTFYKKEELEGFLYEAGFSSVQIFHDEKKHRLCIISQK